MVFDLFTGDDDMRELYTFNIECDVNGESAIIHVSIKTHEYDGRGVGPIMTKVSCDKEIRNRRLIMDAIVSAYEKWYSIKQMAGEKTVKVWVPGKKGRWIGNGEILPDRLA